MSAMASTIVSHLAAIAGEAHVVADPAALHSYAIGGICPAAAIRPGSPAEVSELIKFAAAEKLSVVPCGARTKIEVGLPPRKYDLAIDMTRMDRVIAYDPGDLTLSVEPGIPLKRLSAVLAEQGQFLPLAAPFFHSATVGGTIASAMDSPLRQFYGTPRDFVLGMEFVTGDGTPAKSGGRVVKNVTGYDLHKLMIGAFGTLGVITKINFRTFPVPRETRGFIATFRSAGAALDLRARLARSPLRPLTLDILSLGVAPLFYSEAAARLEPNALPPALLSPELWTFTCGFAGTEKVLARCEAELRALAAPSGAVSISILRDRQVEAAFARKREFVPIALESSPAAVVLKAGVLPSKMNDALAEAEAAANSESLRWAALARGVGVMYVALLPDALNDETRMRVSRASSLIQDACEKVGGHATNPWCPSDWKAQLKVWGTERGDLPLMRKLKSVFDPQGILSPGRFVGGL